MIELERIDEDNISFYKEYERAFDIEFKKYQSRIYPKESSDIIQWYHIKSGNRYIGAIWLEQNLDEKFAVLGIFIAEEKDRNKGIGAQAIEKIKGICFPYMMVDKVILNVRAYNQRAVNCYKKCGFKESKRFVNASNVEVIEMVYRYLPKRKQL